MMIICHKSNKVIKVVRNEKKIEFLTDTITAVLVDLAKTYPQDWIIWCHIDLESNLNFSKLDDIFHHHKIMASYTIGEQNYISNTIGYVEESLFINVNKNVTYPTWLMSSEIGGIHASVLNLIASKIKKDTNFDYYLNSIAKVGMRLGLLCYSEPKLLTGVSKIDSSKATVFSLFRFVKQHYKTRWLFLMLLNLIIYESRFPFLAFVYAFFFRNRNKLSISLESIFVQSNRSVVEQATIDVIIPTIGRKNYLYDVLKDLAQQTYLPKNVIIVEQNPQENSVSELDYLHTEKWPFTIKHTFTHQAGACNARNVALAQVESEWVFMADDDIRFEKFFFQRVIDRLVKYGTSVLTTSCLQLNEIQHYKIIHQSGIFGSGNSFVKKLALDKVRFDKVLEFGYGEDTDFGLQLRSQGHDVIYFPDLQIIHIKAPMGGFRIRIKKQWELETIPPKPSPTILYVLQKHYTLQQFKSYKLVLFLKSLKNESVKNYLNFYKNFKQKWAVSAYWVNQLK